MAKITIISSAILGKDGVITIQANGKKKKHRITSR